MPVTSGATRMTGALWRSEKSRFLAVGSLVAVVDAVIFTLLILIGTPAAISAVPSRVAGAGLGYFLNRKFTFRRPVSIGLRTSMARYWSSFVVFTAVAMLAAQALVILQPAGVVASVWLTVGWLVIEASLVVLAFIVQRRWVFAP